MRVVFIFQNDMFVYMSMHSSLICVCKHIQFRHFSVAIKSFYKNVNIRNEQNTTIEKKPHNNIAASKVWPSLFFV